MANSLPISVGLAGDGDEVDAIENVERTFGVRLNKDDAASWVTVGDVFISLHKELRATDLTDPTLWQRFAEALVKETGVDPAKLDRDSPLLLDSNFSYLTVLAQIFLIVLVILGLAFLFP